MVDFGTNKLSFQDINQKFFNFFMTSILLPFVIKKVKSSSSPSQLATFSDFSVPSELWDALCQWSPQYYISTKQITTSLKKDVTSTTKLIKNKTKWAQCGNKCIKKLRFLHSNCTDYNICKHIIYPRDCCFLLHNSTAASTCWKLWLLKFCNQNRIFQGIRKKAAISAVVVIIILQLRMLLLPPCAYAAYHVVKRFLV